VLIERIGKTWRALATGFSFAVFFGGGALAALTLFPLLGLLTPDPEKRHRRTRQVIRRLFQCYLGMLKLLRVLEIDVSGTDALKRIEGHVVVANHPTLLDVVLLMALIPQVQCIVKHQLWNNRYLGGVVRHAGYIRNDLEPDALLSACQSAMREGANLIIFPQGTRSLPGEPFHFHRGVANIALLSGADIQTVAIRCTPLYLTKSDKWWRVPSRRPHFSVTVGDILSIRKISEGLSRPLAARAVVKRLETYYTGILSSG
jgi:1-acyl-sn-glycerol-3-phosphate acyltransferase